MAPLPAKDRTGWSDIPPDLLEMILRRLTLVDYLRCRRVCRSWKHTVDDAVATKGPCLPAPHFPFLMQLPPDLHFSKPATLFDITSSRTFYPIKTQTWKGFSDFDSVFTVQGWLVLQRICYAKNGQNYDLILFSNPLSGQEFQLPLLSLFPGKVLTEASVKLVFSSAVAPDSSDFLVVACATANIRSTHWKWNPPRVQVQQLAFCKVSDESWTLILDEMRFEEFVIHDWKLYAMSVDVLLMPYSLTLFNLKDSSIIASQVLRLNAILWSMMKYDPSFMLATDGDKILLVARNRNGGACPPTIGFRVFKLDICGTRWIEVDDLDGRVLLIDCAGVKVISAKEINPRELSGGSCIFFCVRERKYEACRPRMKRYLGVFSLKDRSTRYFSHGNYLQSSDRCLWFMPSLW